MLETGGWVAPRNGELELLILRGTGNPSPFFQGLFTAGLLKWRRDKGTLSPLKKKEKKEILTLHNRRCLNNKPAAPNLKTFSPLIVEGTAIFTLGLWIIP